MNDGDFDKRFNYHAQNAVSRPRHEQVREATKVYAALLIQAVPPGRELALVLTKIEEAAFWANAGIARELGDVLTAPAVGSESSRAV